LGRSGCFRGRGRSLVAGPEEHEEDQERQDREQHRGSHHALSLLGAPLSRERSKAGAPPFFESLKLPLVARGRAPRFEVIPVAISSTIFRHDRER
jgi:hypothetical protein